MINKTYIIAEIGPNHNGSIDIALDLIERLSKIGVDAVKFQLSNVRNTLSLDSFKASYQKENSIHKDVFLDSEKRQLTYLEHFKLSEKCRELGVDYLCSAFDLESLIFLDKELDIKKFKIASGEMLSLDMLKYISKKNKEVILSTGMATLDEIGKACTLLNSKRKQHLTILHCVSSYPALIADINLRSMITLKEAFSMPVGYSDHTLGNTTALAAVAIGASVIEKHVTLDRNMPGPDHKASATVKEFSNLVRDIRNVEIALGSKYKKLSVDEVNVSKAARKSIVSNRNILKGEVIQNNDICYKRPGTGFLPTDIELVVGRVAMNDIKKNRVIKRSDIA
jgi:N,N'-diacetyllegionaminate synthase